MVDEALIIQVQKFTFLYDRKDCRFKHRLAKEIAWKTIAEVLESEAAMCEQRWITLRAKYTNLKKKIRDMPSGSGAVEISWPYFEMMGFLDPFLTSRRIISNLRTAGSASTSQAWDSTVQILETQEVMEENDLTLTESQSSPSPLVSPAYSTSSTEQEGSSSGAVRRSTGTLNAKKKKYSHDELANKMASCFDKVSESIQKRSEDQEFGLSLAKDMAVPTLEEKIIFKRNVYTVMTELLEKRKFQRNNE